MSEHIFVKDELRNVIGAENNNAVPLQDLINSLNTRLDELTKSINNNGMNAPRFFKTHSTNKEVIIDINKIISIDCRDRYACMINGPLIYLTKEDMELLMKELGVK